MNTWHFQRFQAKQDFTSGAQDCSLSIINIYKLASSVQGTGKFEFAAVFILTKWLLVAGLFLCCALSHSHPKSTVSVNKL